MNEKFLFGIVALLLFIILIYFLKICVKGVVERRIYIFSVAGLYIYCGMGLFFHEAPGTYLFAFCAAAIIYSAFLIASSRIFFRTFSYVQMPNGLYYSPLIRRWVRMVGYSHFVWLLLSFVFPSYKIDNIWAFAAPDLRVAFESRALERASITAFLEMMQTISFPFLLLHLGVAKASLKKVFALLFLIAYLDYAIDFYIAKAMIARVVLILVVFKMIYQGGLSWRRTVFVVSFLAIFALFGSYYNSIRLGAEFYLENVGDGVLDILNIEISQFRETALPLIDSRLTVDMGRYILWLVTLPIPKFLFGSIEGARLNSEISTIVLGIPENSMGWYVVLPGLVGESFYIFGEYFYIVHFAFLGIFVSFFVKNLLLYPGYSYVVCYFVFMIAYYLPKGGVAAALPPLVNGFLFLFIFNFIRRKNLIRT